MRRCLAPKGLTDAIFVQLRHVKGINIDLNDIVQIQRCDHILYQKIYKYKEFTELITEAADFVGKFV